MPGSLDLSSHLASPADVVWRHATSMESIRKEMMPWLAMTYPKELEGYSLADAEDRLGEVLFPSNILLLGLIPVDRYRLRLTEIGPGYRFVEESYPYVVRTWRHERSVVPAETGCVLRDQVSFAMPLTALDRVAGPIVRAFFEHRHRRLRALFGSADGG